MKITRKEWLLLWKHVEQDISYGSGGTFGDGEKFNVKEAAEVAEIMARLGKGAV